MLEEVFKDPSQKELVIEKAGHIIEQLRLAQSNEGNEGYLSKIRHFASGFFYHPPQGGNSETLRIFAEAVIERIGGDWEGGNLYTFLLSLLRITGCLTSPNTRVNEQISLQ